MLGASPSGGLTPVHLLSIMDWRYRTHSRPIPSASFTSNDSLVILCNIRGNVNSDDGDYCLLPDIV